LWRPLSASESMSMGEMASRVAGETPALVFISSVMVPELEAARLAAKRAFEVENLTVSWLFEYTPASSEPPDEAYLAKVRQAQIVIWIAGAHTTRPVEREIEAAILSRRRLWAFLLPAEARDDATKRIIEALKPRTKFVTLQPDEDLQEVISLTLGDEIIRMLKQDVGIGPGGALEAMLRESRARCMTRFVAAGVTAVEAEHLLDAAASAGLEVPIDVNVGQLKVLQGDFGVGKSLRTDLLHQRRLRAYQEDPTRPYPIYLEATNALRLEHDAIKEADRLGDPSLHGADLIVDGLDQVDPSEGLRLLAEARYLALAWPATRVIATTRPTELANPDEVVSIRPMLTDEAEALVSQLAGRSVQLGPGSSVPPSVVDACRRPLFAILLGKYLATSAGTIRTSAELIDGLVSRSLRTNRTTSAGDAASLRRLAILSTDRSSDWVPALEVTSDPLHREDLVRTRLVADHEGRLRFGLPILTQYFAARALISGEKAVASIIADPPMLDRWHYALVLAVGTGTFDEVSAILTPLVKGCPYFAPLVISEALKAWGGGRGSALPNEMDCGERLRSSMEAWRAGVPSLDQIVIPHYQDGTLGTVGTRVSGSNLTMSWYTGEPKLEPIVLLPRPAPGGIWPEGWGQVTSAEPGEQPAWPWRWTLDLPVDLLSRFMRMRPILPSCSALVEEAAWKAALELTGKGDNWPYPIPVAEIQAGLNARATAGLSAEDWPLGELRSQLAVLGNSGVNDLAPPWNVPTLGFGGGWVWSPFTKEEVLVRVEGVFRAALGCYEALCDGLLRSLAPRLRKHALLPAEVVVLVSYARDLPGPTLQWFLEPLALGEVSQVVVREAAEMYDWDFLHELGERTRTMRPQASSWISPILYGESRHLWGARPATELATDWLWEDLRELKWVEGFL
jgi:hypothetical protein